MHDGKVRRMSVDVEHQYLTEDSKVRVYLSEVRSTKEETLADKAMVVILELFYSLTATYFVGKWAVAYAYAERGYVAYGGEYLLIGMTFVVSMYVISNFFKHFRR